MKVVCRKKMGLTIADIWAPGEAWRKNAKCDVAVLHSSSVQDMQSRLTVQHTLLTNLQLEEAELWENIKSKNFKYEIRRSEKDGVEFFCYTSQDLRDNEELLQKFCRCYQEMYREKGMQNKLSLVMLRNYILEDALYLSVAFYKGEPIVFHSYVDCGEGVRLWHSCSNFRSEKDEASIIGRANKRLHWIDWLYFRERKFHFYDWGGVFSYDGENGIDQFKKAFGGEPHDYYNGQVGVTIIGKIVLFMKKCCRRG